MIKSSKEPQQFIVKIFISLLLITPFVGSDLYTKHLAHQYLAEDNGVIQSVEINQYLLAESPIRNNQPWYYPEINQTVYKLISLFFFSLILLGLFFHVEDILDINRSVRHEGWGGLSWAVPIAGGFAGNIIEILFFGGATDFLILPDGNWIFNLADIYISLGLALILISELFLKKFDKDTYIFWGSYLAVIFTLISVNSYAEEMSCEETWNDYYDNLSESEQTPSDSLFKSVLIDDCHNNYRLMIERQKEMMRDTSMHAYAVGDYATAYKEFKILAEHGDATAQQNLGWMYNNGEGVTQDYKEAMKWWRLAAEQGTEEAVRSQHNLGWMYYIGEGVTQDYKEAMKWFRLAAEQGTEEAVRSQHNLGWMYDQGLGVIQDNVIAHMWYNIAVSNGGETAKNNKDLLAKKMTLKQIAEAEKLTDECIKKNYKDCGH